LIQENIPVRGVAVLCPISVGPDAVPSHLKEKYLALEENSDAPLVDEKLYRYFMSKSFSSDFNDGHIAI
jgi:hypothetical protein